MTQKEICWSSDTQALLHEANMTVAQVLRNLDADTTLTSNKRSVRTVRWFLKKVLMFNNFGRPVLK